MPHPRSLSVGGRQKLGRMPSPFLLLPTISCLPPSRSAEIAPVLLLNVTPTRRCPPPPSSTGPASSCTCHCDSLTCSFGAAPFAAAAAAAAAVFTAATGVAACGGRVTTNCVSSSTWWPCGASAATASSGARASSAAGKRRASTSVTSRWYSAVSSQPRVTAAPKRIGTSMLPPGGTLSDTRLAAPSPSASPREAGEAEAGGSSPRRIGLPCLRSAHCTRTALGSKSCSDPTRSRAPSLPMATGETDRCE